MLARVAENIYWLGRYLERVDGTVRLLNAHTNLLLDSPYTSAVAGWAPLLAVTGAEELYEELYPAVTAACVSEFIISDKRNIGSLASSIQAVRYNLRACRDTMPSSLYATINRLCLTAKNSFTDNFNVNSRHLILGEIEQQMLAISGAISSTMNRDQSYQFMRIGIYLERADMTARILDVRSANLLPAKGAESLLPFQNRQWVSVLQSVSALQMYRRHSGAVAGSQVLSYLLQNSTSPRSYRYCIDQLQARLQTLGGGEEPLAELSKLCERLDSAQMAGLADDPNSLHAFVDELEIHLARVSDGISNSYYSPKEI